MKYQLFTAHVTVQRLIWYAYYIPVMAISLSCLYLSFYIHQPKEWKAPESLKTIALIGVLLTIGVLTNDFHFWAFQFPNGIDNAINIFTRSWLYYAYAFFVLALLVVSCSIILYKCHKYVSKKLWSLPMIPIAAEVIYVILYILDLAPQINGVYLWNVGEMFGFNMISFLEFCIQIGMIPANIAYEEPFTQTHFPAAILDSNEKLVYQTAGISYPFPDNNHLEIHRHAISGGSIVWAVDMTHVQELSHQLEDMTQQLEARNTYLAEENRILQEKAEVEMRNLLYDEISKAVQPQLTQIDELLADTTSTFESKLPKIAVLKAYIKRRSNMELIASAHRLPLGELTAAITESLEYIQLCTIKTAIYTFGTGSFPATMMIAAYEQFEAIIEESLDTLTHLNVTLRAEHNQLIVRMLMKADNFAFEQINTRKYGYDFYYSATITKDNQDMIIVLTFTEGGSN